jgi:hypothetical protein
MAATYGANPTNIQWTVVRGDTAKLRIEFLESDETTAQDTSTWVYAANTFDVKSNTSSELQTVAGNGYVDIIASPELTSTWGTSRTSPAVAELSFDLQVTIDAETVWTPIIGKIMVIPDVTVNPVAP